MKKRLIYLTFCIACVGLWASCSGGKKVATTPAEKVDAVAAGAKIYSQNCNGCHSKGAPNLSLIHDSRDKIIDIVTNGEGKMPSFKSKLTEPEIVYVAEYVLSLRNH